MPRMKRTSSGDFDNILAALDRRESGEMPPPMRAARRLEPKVPEPEVEAVEAPRPKNRLRRLLGNITFPWPTGIGGFIGGFGPRSQAPYAEEAAEVQSAPGVEQPPRDVPKLEAENAEAVKVEPAKTEDQIIAEELGLGPTLAPVDLQRIRRDFAKKNHPDRFEPARRPNAARRMSIANMLIDEQMRQCRTPR